MRICILKSLIFVQLPGKKTTKLWVPDEEVSPETMVKVSDMHRSADFNLLNIPYYYYIIGVNSSCYKDMAIEVIQVFMFLL